MLSGADRLKVEEGVHEKVVGGLAVRKCLEVSACFARLGEQADSGAQVVRSVGGQRRSCGMHSLRGRHWKLSSLGGCRCRVVCE